jgi:hypothetical protein
MTKGSNHSNHVGSQPRVPAPPRGDNLLHTKGSGSTPAPKAHREPHSAQVKVRDSDQDGN